MKNILDCDPKTHIIGFFAVTGQPSIAPEESREFNIDTEADCSIDEH